jgi:tetratricopeptide (TPR) repeat protein
LFTTQRLFGDVGLPSNTLTYEPFLERARVQREQDSDVSARLALGGYVVARLVDKLLLLNDDAELVEAFRWQLEAVRRHVSDLPDHAPETAHLAGILTSVPDAGAPTSSLWMSLTAYAYFLEHEARLEESLEMLMLAARAQGQDTSPADFAAYALFAGRLNRQLARWDMAIACYTAAETAASHVGDSFLMLRGRLGVGAVHRGRGNYPAARASAERVVQEATELQLADAQALAYADLGVVYSLQGLPLEAVHAHFQAFQLSTDNVRRMRALGDLALGLFEIGAYDAARLAFQIVADSDAELLVRMNARLELMDLESSVGNRVAFERCRAAVEEYGDRMSPSMSCDYRYKLGVGFARFGQAGRARAELTKGLTAAEKFRLNAWYFKIDQKLGEVLTPSSVQSPTHAVSELSEAPVVEELMIGLREYAAAPS